MQTLNNMYTNTLIGAKMWGVIFPHLTGMYAQKRRLKKFHDAHIINKEFKKGDLVLVYTLKQHTSKLKKCSMWDHL